MRNRNLDTDGWWVFVALLEEVRRGKLLVIKGPRDSLFPSPCSSTPLRNLARSAQYDPATWQAQLAAARAARASDRDASTLLGDAQPFAYQPDMPDVDAVQVAGSEGTPRNNLAQNKQFKAVVKALGLNKNQARQLHDDISKQGLGYHEMLERGQDMFGGGDD
ncbi:hypothetical protein LJ655_05905 [Paraburkholderia sp. MMS20-SJTN17]|uniref:Uncharacterized protein n=1 Tax=Paraburkholderia translucens TaxID=2886945 RepID=A0ABS8K9S6_9BURK|nr:hypothetical protein [Paraburkholderia sp. MMS20-SJTN17]MCC8401432.1 hypothetical protein [Paraburkholderia sp. MMS20-SJTN17]